MKAPTAPYRIRRVTPAEWPAVRELRLRALKCDPAAFGSTLAREEAFTDDLWQERTTRTATSETSSQWVAVDPSERLVGTAVVAEAEGRVNVFSMWVEPGLRNQGVGGRLLDAGLAWAGKRFAGREIHLEVNPRQVSAVRLYASRGFRFVGQPRPLDHTPGEHVQRMIRTAQ